MDTESGPMIVTTGPCPTCGTHHVWLHHRSYPGLSGIGATPRAAAEDLLRRLAREADATADPWHRGGANEVIAEVRAFVDRQAEDPPRAAAPVTCGEAHPPAAGGRTG